MLESWVKMDYFIENGMSAEIVKSIYDNYSGQDIVIIEHISMLDMFLFMFVCSSVLLMCEPGVYNDYGLAVIIMKDEPADTGGEIHQHRRPFFIHRRHAP